MPQPKLEKEKSSTKIYPYQSDSLLQLQGVTSATITANQTSLSTKFYIVKGNYGSLLGKQTAIALDLLCAGPPKVTATINVPSDNMPPSTQEIIDKFDSFSRDRTFQKFQITTTHWPNHCSSPVERVPYHTKEKISTELSRLLKSDIIEKVDGPTTWLNPIVVLPKSSGKTGLCLDMWHANKAISCERHIIPKIEDILTELHGAKYFSKIDLTEGYHQIKLDQNSRHITNFATNQGLYRYKRLIYGISSTFESFKKQIEITISSCPKAKKHQWYCYLGKQIGRAQQKPQNTTSMNSWQWFVNKSQKMQICCHQNYIQWSYTFS